MGTAIERICWYGCWAVKKTNECWLQRELRFFTWVCVYLVILNQNMGVPLEFVLLPLFKFYFLLKYSLITMLITAVQESDSVLHIYTFFFISFSIMDYHRLLNSIPCAIQ